jgi:hypothetical protein
VGQVEEAEMTAKQVENGPSQFCQRLILIFQQERKEFGWSKNDSFENFLPST